MGDLRVGEELGIVVELDRDAAEAVDQIGRLRRRHGGEHRPVDPAMALLPVADIGARAPVLVLGIVAQPVKAAGVAERLDWTSAGGEQSLVVPSSCSWSL